MHRRRPVRTGLRRCVPRTLADEDARRLAEGRRLGQHAERALLDGAFVMLEEDQRLHEQLPLREQIHDLLGGRAVVLELQRVAARRRAAEATHLRARAALSDVPGVQSQVGDREALLRLRLRAHDPLERRVARLVDRVRDGDDGRQRRGDMVVAELRLPLGVYRSILHIEPGHLRHERQLEVARQRRRQSTAPSESDACWPNSTRSAPSRSSAFASTALVATRSDPASRLVGDEHGAVCSHRETLAQGFGCPFWTHGDENDLALAGRVAQAQSLLDRVRVERIETGLAGAVETHRAGIDALRPALGNLLDADGNLHRAKTLTARASFSASNKHRQTLLGSGAPSANFGVVDFRRKTARGLIFAAAAASAVGVAGGVASAQSDGPVPRLIFPIVGSVAWSNDFGAARYSGSHQGNDLMAPRRTIAVAAEAGQGQVLDVFGSGRVHALPLRQQRHDVPLHPPQQRRHEGQRQPRQVRRGHGLLQGPQGRRVGRGRRGDRLRRQLGRRRQHRSPPPLRGAPQRWRRRQPVSVPDEGRAADLRHIDRRRP